MATSSRNCVTTLANFAPKALWKRFPTVSNIVSPLTDIASVSCTAYERQSFIVKTNLPFENWTEVLGSERLAGAPLDRLTHRCQIVETTGESYPLKDARRRRRNKKE